MQDRQRNSQLGMTLLETMIVLGVMAILITMAVMGLGKAPRNLDRQNAAREFKVFLERARFDSVRRRANVCSEMSKVTIDSSTAFTLYSDFNQNGVLDTSETRPINLTGDLKVVGNTVTLPVTIRFDERGHALLTDCVSTPPANVPLFYFCNGDCTSLTVTSQNANTIYVSPTGTVAMMPGGQSMPTFNSPAVTNVASNTQINPLLAVWIPMTPTPTPSPTPSVSPTPIATPTPRDCVGSPFEKPIQTGCYCRSPMWVRSNDFCK
jgi:Tfp pilus assembly protein FimT